MATLQARLGQLRELRGMLLHFPVTEIITQRVLWSAIFKNTQTLPQLAGLCTYHFLGAALIALVKPYLGRLYSSIPFPNVYILSSFYFPLFISPTLVLKLKDTRILIH